MVICLLTSFTLFPYTTLFRSDRVQPREKFCEQQSSSPPREKDLLRAPNAGIGLERERDSDRKSTRLNSSHRCNSYAVFCLKKKNKTASDVRDKYVYVT